MRSHDSKEWQATLDALRRDERRSSHFPYANLPGVAGEVGSGATGPVQATAQRAKAESCVAGRGSDVLLGSFLTRTVILLPQVSVLLLARGAAPMDRLEELTGPARLLELRRKMEEVKRSNDAEKRRLTVRIRRAVGC